jgi:hypothetical protein
MRITTFQLVQLLNSARAIVGNVRLFADAISNCNKLYEPAGIYKTGSYRLQLLIFVHAKISSDHFPAKT